MGTLGVCPCLFYKKKLGTALDTDLLKLCRFECFPFFIFFFTFFSSPPFSFTVPPFFVFSVSEVPDSQPYPFSFFLSFQIPTPLLLLSSETTRTPEDSGLSPSRQIGGCGPDVTAAAAAAGRHSSGANSFSGLRKV